MTGRIIVAAAVAILFAGCGNPPALSPIPAPVMRPMPTRSDAGAADDEPEEQPHGEPRRADQR